MLSMSGYEQPFYVSNDIHSERVTANLKVLGYIHG